MKIGGLDCSVDFEIDARDVLTLSGGLYCSVDFEGVRVQTQNQHLKRALAQAQALLEEAEQ
eukprot:2938126-Rhodomonas_salina.4